jgi:exopolysaccharide biosynthesis polyprenyl glycosylphosphotransferase
MSPFRKQDRFLLLIGDIVVFYLSLWIVLTLRYAHIPSDAFWNTLIIPFTILFAVWCLVFFIAGLYEKRTTILNRRLARVIFSAQIANILVAIVFFYFIPYYGITPKTTLFIYLIVSLILISLWRIYGTAIFGFGRKQQALIIASGEEMKELIEEVNTHDRYNLRFASLVDLDAIGGVNFEEEVVKPMSADAISIIAVDFKNEKAEPILPHLYDLIFDNVIFIDMYKIYEDVFDRIPLSLISYPWFLENISLAPKKSYDIMKRLMDIVVATVAGLVSLVFYPFIIAAIKLDDGGPVFIHQIRVGKADRPIHIVKFRTMSANDNGVYAEGKSENRITRVGAFLRRSRLDELPQLWRVIVGDLSLIGPRPEFPSLVAQYEKQISYYGIRHLIKPGLSGWAQIYHDNHPHHAVAVLETKEKLSYDLFYLKNRSFWLDITIGLKTISKLLSRSGA